MTALVIALILFLLIVIVVQISKVGDLAAKIRGEKESEMISNNRTALWMLIFMIAFLVLGIGSALYYKNSMLGYGPHEAASEHGVLVDSLFNVTLFFTGIVFVITHILLFWYAYKYRAQEGRKALFFPHSNTLEYIWTAVPAVVMAFLVVKGLVVWNDIMPDVDPNEDYIEIEATGYQFAWDLRYPGPDGELGIKEYTKINLANNPLGMDWEDSRNYDDFMPSEIVLPVNRKVRVRITAKDVLHNFYLPHFRVKMDAIPGLPTYFIFTPTKTTAEYKERLRAYPEWNEPYDVSDPDSPTKWEAFNFELACAELCGKGHYSMRRVVRIVTEQEYEAWLTTNNSYYLSNIRNTDDDPNKGKLLDFEIENRKSEFEAEMEDAYKAENPEDKTVLLKHLFFETGTASLTADSKYELANVIQLMNKYPNMQIELGGHTDNTGDSVMNMGLSQQRADIVKNSLLDRNVSEDRLTAVGYGELKPIDSNDTDEGREMNRRTELTIISQ